MVLAIATIFVVSTRGQGFLNLNFEAAYNLPGNPGYGVLVPATNALPDWSAYGGYANIEEISYITNRTSGGPSSVALVGGSLALSGDFSAELYNDGLLSQTGSVPNDAESLQFEAYGLSGSSGFSITLGGDTLSYSAISEESNYTIYGANIPANMDGQTEALAFECFGVGSGLVVLDNIEFSPMNVPEPPECGLIGLGAILIGVRLWRRSTMRT
jgi:hypothetical protein